MFFTTQAGTSWLLACYQLTSRQGCVAKRSCNPYSIMHLSLTSALIASRTLMPGESERSAVARALARGATWTAGSDFWMIGGFRYSLASG